MKMRLFPVGLLSIAAISMTACHSKFDDSDATAALPIPERETIAVCPTFLDYALQLDADKYAMIPTGSTAESMQFLASGAVDFVLAGRALKPQEPSVNHVLLGEGYSFLARQEMHIGETALRTGNFVTDLNPAQLQEDLGINNIQHVDNIYDSLEDHIAITDFGNTDYARAAPVHVLREDGSRVLLSRTPVLYCAKECPSELQSSIRKLLSLSPSFL